MRRVQLIVSDTFGVFGLAISYTNTKHAKENGTTSENKLSPGELPLKPHITPALGVGGFILIALGAILALIGIRKLRYRKPPLS